MLNVQLKQKTLVSVLQNKSIYLANKPAYLFLENGKDETKSITYSELDNRARTIAVQLQSKNLFGQRALLLFPAGLDFIAAFIGCLYAGVVAVPMSLSRRDEIEKSREVINAIAQQADIAAILTIETYLPEIKKHHPQLLNRHQLFLVDAASCNGDVSMMYQNSKITGDNIAYLQYSSGSGGTLKGAIISHKNLIHSLHCTAKAWRYSKNSVTFTWAPHSHVYGLVCGLLLPLYCGSRTVFMPPEVFIQTPIRWLEGITKYRVTHSGCPNFGYDFCAREIKNEALAPLNLKSWKVAANGGEKVQYETLIRFSEKFALYGFDINCFYPVYGMSEMTGVIATKRYRYKDQSVNVLRTQSNHIGCGRFVRGLQGKIIDPEKLMPVAEGKIGEIWLTGKSLAAGYWGDISETKLTFCGTFPGAKKFYFRTGDLGFIKGKEVYITGRLKEVIIIYGKKYFLSDLEMTITKALKDFYVSPRVLVFSLLIEEKEEVVVVQELASDVLLHHVTIDEIIKVIKHDITAQYGINLYGIVLVKNNSIPQTKSGKLQRIKCQQQFLEGNLEVIKQFLRGKKESLAHSEALLHSSVTDEMDKESDLKKVTPLSKYFYPDFIKIVSSVLNIHENTIDLNSDFSSHGIDSIRVIQLATRFNETWGLSITPANLFEYFTLAEFFNDLLNKYSEVLVLYYSLTDAKEKAEKIADQLFEKEAIKNAAIPAAFQTMAQPPLPSLSSSRENDIAIIGMSGKFPEASDLEVFWNNLLLGKNAITEIPKDRWNWEAYDGDPLLLGSKTKIRWGGFVPDMMAFDADFFNISPREAELMDPQQRLFLQVVWNAIENAGYTSTQLSIISTGLFVGVFGNDYSELIHKKSILDPYVATGITHSILANRVSYLLNLHGPSLAIDTACSSSLVAIHYAVQAIQKGDCTLAIAGGVNALLSPTHYLVASQAGMLSEEGQCKTFDKQANGYVRGEGAGAILLKSLQAAKADGDHIYGVIKGSAVNHGGHTSSLTVPNPHAQAEVIVAACERAKIAVENIRYIETHGTGTSLGDPIEINGLKKAFAILEEKQGNKISDHAFCGLGALKTHIGHLESAAGIAGIIKVLLVMQHEKIPANLHFSELNPSIDLINTPFYLVNKTQPFVSLIDQEGKKIPRFAGVSSFGFGGTNAHVIIEEPPLAEVEEATSHHKKQKIYLIALSAKTDSALEQKISDFYYWLCSEKNMLSPLSSISYTLNVGRDHFKRRCVFIVESVEELQETLNKVLQKEASENFMISKNDKNSFINKPIFKALFKQLSEELKFTEKLSLSDVRDKLLALGNFYIEGHDLDWHSFYSPEEKKRIPLPVYPFAKKYYGLEALSYPQKIDFNERIADAEKITETPSLLIKSLDKSIPGLKSDESVESVSQNFKQIISRLLKKSIHSIDAKASLNELGLDSMTLKELALEIENYYGIQINPSLFFIYQTIHALSQYLLNAYPKEIEKTSKKSVKFRQSGEKNSSQAIAIIGMQGFFPQSKDLDAFWQHLENGEDLVTEIPVERWDWRENYGNSKADSTKTNSKWGGFVSDIDQFDASFFNVSPREANLMDPQHRLFMEVVWKTIEDAGYDPFALAEEEAGLFVGAEFNEYQSMIAETKKIFHGYVATGNSSALLANRISYFLNLQGPSEVIHTACSSALVAINRAVNALRSGECKVAIAGGVSLMLNPDTFVITSQLGILSPDGRCKTFDQSANGYVKGEGVAAILLKPLEKAQREGDHIYGVIKGSTVSHGGKAQSLTAPNAVAQSQLLIKTYTQADIDPETITYIETHGTGTELGDPVEIEGLKLAFKQNESVSKINYCALGSVKTNIGHLEPASGMAGIIKILLAMQHEKIPANLHFKKCNPYIHLEKTPFYLAEKLQPWNRLKDKMGNEIPRRAGVSSFGFGGSIAHILIEEANFVSSFTPTLNAKPYYLVTLSAKKEESLRQKIIELHEWLKRDEHTTTLAALSFTLNVGRTHFEKRCAMVVSSLQELSKVLNKLGNYFPIDSHCNGEDDIFFSRQSQVNFRQAHGSDENEYKNKLLLLANSYIKNDSIDWDSVYETQERRRVAALPSYPFLKSRYWFDAELPAQDNVKVDLKSETLVGISKSNESETLTLQDFTFAYLQKIFAEKLRLVPEQISIEETYEVYGVDSLLSLEITSRLEEDFGALPKTLLYEKSQLRDLALYLQKNFGSILEKLQASDKNISYASAKFATSEQSIKFTAEPRKTEENSSSESIAIIGLSGIYPMAKDIDELWLNLKEGRDCITEIPKERWNYKDYPILVNGEEVYYKYGGFIPDVDKFDPLFFNISPREAALMDPQERLFLQSAWTTIEDAGYTREKLRTSANNHVGVFAGVTYNFYPLFIAEEWSKGNRLPLDIQLFSVANRVSYFLNLNGPSYVVDTACSSSLAAIHLACESILKGECKMAIAGGVNLSIHPCKYHFLGSYGFMSLQGRCASFGKGGSGYVPAEGAGSVLLKPLSLAIEENDRIYGVIKGSSMNHGGKTSGYTVPNPNAQADLVKIALKKANVDARTISYIEAHGTGTSLGDPIEVKGLQEAFEEYTGDKQFCAIGSVKSNIGHLESAAGISQLTKVLLQMRHKKLVPSLHAQDLNPHIDFANTPFFVQQELKDWQPAKNHPRRAGISSFGAGGTNIHVIVEEFQNETMVSYPDKQPMLFLLSATNADQLQQYAKNIQAFLIDGAKNYFSENDLNIWVRQLCYTSQTGRESMSARLAIMAMNYQELVKKLTTYIESSNEAVKNVWTNHSVQSSLSFDNDLSVLIEQKHLEALAELWIKGIKIPWQQLHTTRTLKTEFLPTYPFVKRRCWITSEPSTLKPPSVAEIFPSEIKPAVEMEQKTFLTEAVSANVANDNVTRGAAEVTELVIQALAKALELDIREINPATVFHDYGLDSITGIHFVAELSVHFPDVLSPMDLYRYSTVKRLTQHIIETCQSNRQMPTEAESPISTDNFMSLDDSGLLAEILHLSDEEISELIEKETL